MIRRSLVKKHNKILKPPRSKIETCLSCGLFAKCKNSKKGYGFWCKLYKPNDFNFDIEDDSAAERIINRLSAKKSKTPLIIKPPKKKFYEAEYVENEEELDVRHLIDAVINDTSDFSHDFRIDDRDFPTAKNFYDFTVSGKFLSPEFRPFPKQLQIGLKLFTDVCYKCSDAKYADNIPVDEKLENILNKITLLEHGKCVKCGLTRLDMWQQYGAKRYVELVSLLGQRCITGSSRVLTTKGIVRIRSISKEPWTQVAPRYQRDKNQPRVALESGMVVPYSNLLKIKPERTISIETKSGMFIEGTCDHPIKIMDDFKTLQNVNIGDVVPVHIGQNIWGRGSLNLSYVRRDLNPYMYKTYINPITKINRKGGSTLKIYAYRQHGRVDEDIASLLGLWVAEGCGNNKRQKKNIYISNTNKEILQFCRKALNKLYPNSPKIPKDSRSVCIASKWLAHHFDVLVDGVWRKSAQKKIPDHILVSSKKIVISFMRGLFEGDGYVCFGDRHKFGKGSVEYSTLSRTLALDISTILNNLGIIHCVFRKSTWATNGSAKQISKTAYVVLISGLEQIIKFKSEIGFMSVTKTGELDNLITRLSCKQINMPYWYEKYPNTIKQEFLAIISQISNDLKDFRVYTNGVFRTGYYSIRSFFDQSSDFRRIYSDNVALSQHRLNNFYKTVINHRLWIALRKETQQELLIFYNKYYNKNIYWTTVTKKYKYNKKKKTYDFTIPDYHRFMANGLLNHNSGKSSLTRQIAAYTIHRFIKLQNPTRIFPGISPGEILHATFTATSFKQAKEIIFDNLVNMISESPWFQEYHKMLDYYGKKYGEEIYRQKEVYFDYKHRNLLIYCAGPDKRNLRGRTRFLGACDELSWILSSVKDSVKFNADEIYDAMANSFLTLRAGARQLWDQGYYDVPPPMFCNISSPSSSKDKTVRLLKESEGSDTILGTHGTVFEINPNVKPEDLEQIQRADPASFRKNFLAIPPLSAHPFIEDKKAVLACIDYDRKNQTILHQNNIRSETGLRFASGVIKFRRSGNYQPPTVLAIDAGAFYNSFSGVVMHYEEIMGQNIPVIDGAFEIIPKPEEPVSISDVYDNVLSPIIRGCNVKLIAADRWNSMKLLSDAEAEHGIAFSTYSVRYKDMLEAKASIYNNELIIPKPECKIRDALTLAGNNYPFSLMGKPIAHLCVQILTVEDLLGKKVEKGTGYTDDIFRAFVLGHAMLVDGTIRAQFLTDPPVKRNDGFLGVVGSYGQGQIGERNRPGYTPELVKNSIGAVGSYGAIGRQPNDPFSNVFSIINPSRVK